MIRPLSLVVSTILIFGFQTGLIPFLSSPGVVNTVAWRAGYYGFWALAIGTAIATPIGKRPSATALLCVAFSAASIALTFIHPLDPIAKNFIVAMVLFACVSIIADSIGAPMLRVCALATVFNAVVCLVDIMHPLGLNPILGRASNLIGSPNGAAAVLLLGAAASYRVVDQPWRGYLVLLVAAALVATLSKSTLLAAFAIFVVAGGAATLWRRPQPGHVAFLVLLIGWLAAALLVNDRFLVAATNAFEGMSGSVSALREARNSIAAAAKWAAPAPTTTAEQAAVMPAESVPAIEADTIKEIGKRIATEGDVNSVSARGLLMERAWLSYRQHPIVGQGFAQAHALAPHNSFLLLALALGLVGWLIALAIQSLSSISLRTRGLQGAALPMATFTVLMVSHDIMIPGLLAPLVIGINCSQSSDLYRGA